DRHPAPGRHREEERDHDDRLRPGGGAGRGQEPGGGDLPGVRAALPADHDDDDGRAPGRAPAGHRARNRIGAAPAARDRHRGRAHREPGAHALHDAGRLPVSRPRTTVVGARARRPAAAARARRRGCARAVRRQTVRWRLGGRLALASALLGLVSGCPVGPDYVRPSMISPDAYKEIDGWKIARPGDAAAPGAWWEIFDDPELNALEARVSISNQNLAVAEAQYRQARALVREARAAYFPTVTLGLGFTRSRQSTTFVFGSTGGSSGGTSAGSATSTGTSGSSGSSGGARSDFQLGLDFSWELDV